MQSGIPRCSTRIAGRKPSPRSASVVGQAQIVEPAVAEQVELGAVGVRRVDDRRPLAEAARVGEQLDRAHAVLGEALLDLARLLVGVDVQDEPLGGCVAADLLEPVARARADGVGGDPDVDPARRGAPRPRRGTPRPDGCRIRSSPPRAYATWRHTKAIPASSAASAAA